MIEVGIFKLLCDSASVAAIVSDRIYPVLLPEGERLPAATYQVVSVKPLYALGGRVDVTQMRLQVDTWASTYPGATTLAAAIVSVLDGYSGPLPDGTSVFGIQLWSISDLYGSDARVYRKMLQFGVQFAVAS